MQHFFNAEAQRFIRDAEKRGLSPICLFRFCGGENECKSR